MSITKQAFGNASDGTDVALYTLTNIHGLRVKLMTYGATITSVETPDRSGKLENVTLSLSSFQDYLQGASVLRFDGRPVRQPDCQGTVQH